MAQNGSFLAHQRPSFPGQSQSYTHPSIGGRPPSQFSPQSPQTAMSFNSPSPTLSQMSPNYGGQPPAKRPRMSPDAPPSFGGTADSPRPFSPVSNQISGQVNGNMLQQVPKLGSMAPPQRPIDRVEDGEGGFKGMNINFDDEDQNTISFAAGGARNVNGPNSASTQHEPTTEERVKREEQRKDWAEAGYAQYELYDPFTFTATINDKIKSASFANHLQEIQAGVMVNTQKDRPPPTVRVNGLEGATRVIDAGQPILDTREKGERLSELVKLISLSAKARLTGILASAARLSRERREHSRGRVPEDWADLAVRPKTSEGEPVDASSSAASAGMKRTHAQAGEEAQRGSAQYEHPSVTAFKKQAVSQVQAEKARLEKRRKRLQAATEKQNEVDAAAQEAALAAALESDQKSSKKKKAAESKPTEQQQQKNTNDAVAMATGMRFGGIGGKKKYAWMTGGTTTPRTPVGSAVPSRSASSTNLTKGKDKQGEGQRDSQLGGYDEASEVGITGRDLMLVLETDGRAAQSFVRATSILDEATSIKQND